MVTIGLVSYSWHLWHWPLISFMRTNFGQSTRVEELSVGVASLALAGLTYHYIEWPIRACDQGLLRDHHQTGWITHTTSWKEVLTRRSSKRCAMAFREFCSSLRRRNFFGMLLIALCNPSERTWIFALSHGKGRKTEEGGLWLFCSKSLIDIKLSG